MKRPIVDPPRAVPWLPIAAPGSFAFDPASQFLYCCNQRADHLAVFRVDQKTGGLTLTGHFTPVGNPSIMVFRKTATAG